MADVEIKSKRLQVATMRPDDSGRGIARLPRAMMTELGLTEGDVIELVGKRVTPARAVGPYPEDEGLEIIRLDGLQRANAEIGSGDYRRDPQGRIEARAARRLRAGAEESAPAGLGPGAEAQLRDEAARPPATSSPPPASSRSRAATSRPNCARC